MRSKGYFQGWYFKCSNGDKTIAFIPAYHRSENITSASLQVITDDEVFNIPFQKLRYTTKPLSVKIGDCVFSEKGVTLYFQSNECKLKGQLRFDSLSPVAYDIMGPFALVPFMQCRHSVFSMSHRIDGNITLNDKSFDFDNGIGYIEGDRVTPSQNDISGHNAVLKRFFDGICGGYPCAWMSFYGYHWCCFAEWQRTSYCYLSWSKSETNGREYSNRETR